MRTRSAGSCARRRSALGSPGPPYQARSAAVLPYQPGGHTRMPSARLALDRISADHDVAEHEGAELREGIGRLSDRVAEGDRARAVGHDAVEGTVAGDHCIGPAPVPVHGHDHVDRAAETLDVAVEGAPQAGGASAASAGTTGSTSSIAPGSSQ